MKLDKGRLITILLTSLILLWYFSDCLLNLNTTLLTQGGDGLQAYYNSLYHLKFDNEFWHFKGMNYPYGDSVFYTNGQPLIVNLLKLIKPVLDLSNYLVAVLNLLVILSFLVCSNYIYLIFKYFKIDTLWAVLFAVAITFLSPQLMRVYSHVTLAYLCAIPMYLFYMLKFTNEYKTTESIKLGVASLFFLFVHPYFIVFFIFISFPFALFLFLTKRTSLIHTLKHFSFQVIIPIALFFLLQQTEISDRPKFPLGFLEYKSNFSGIFFSPYSSFFSSFKFKYPEWEGQAYVGLFSFIVSLFLIFLFIKKLIQSKSLKFVFSSENWRINLLLLSSLLALIFSFAFPFNLDGYDQYLQYAGPIRQFRGIGRFSWLFFYVINIFSVFLLVKKLNNKSTKFKNVVLSLCLVVISIDVYSNIKLNKKKDLVKSPFISESYWKEFDDINWKEFQAIVPFPYFHVGSENISLVTNSKIMENVFSISSHTGLPITAVFLSRTSLSQTFENLAFISEPYKPLKFLKKCSTKPFLIIAKTSELATNAIEFLENCTLIKKCTEFDLYKISPKKLIAVQQAVYSKTEKEISSRNWIRRGDYQISDTLSEVIFSPFKQKNNKNKLPAKFEFKEIFRYNKVGEFALSSKNQKEYDLTFWVENFTQELIPRTFVELTYFDADRKAIQFDFFSFYEKIKIIDNKKALIQFNMNLPEKLDSIKLYVRNIHVTDLKTKLKINNVLIRPSNVAIYKKINDSTLFYNNRTYIK